jgi:hypothetical protein
MPNTSDTKMRVARAVLAAGLILAAVAGIRAAAEDSGARPSVLAYRGLGTWVDIYDAELWNDPPAAVQAMQVDGIRTIYLQSSNFSHADIEFPTRFGEFIDTAHGAGMRVVAWYLPSLAHLKVDFRRSMAAIAYRSIAGSGVDSFALDIESRVVTEPIARTARLLTLSQRIRDAVGPGYPLGAITPNAVSLAKPTSFWPDFPYESLTQYYDVFLPMCYSGTVAAGTQAVHDYAANCARLVRAGTGNVTVRIHQIGGVADNYDTAEIEGFVHAVREYGLMGGSLYDFMTTEDPAAWDLLRTIPVNPRESPPLPMPIASPDAVGNIPRGDRTHPKEVFYLASSGPGAFDLTYQGFDLGSGDVTLSVNWQPVKTVGRGPAGAWTRTRTISIADEFLQDNGPNLIGFTAAGDYPHWSTWGVRAVSLSPSAA